MPYKRKPSVRSLSFSYYLLGCVSLFSVWVTWMTPCITISLWSLPWQAPLSAAIHSWDLLPIRSETFETGILMPTCPLSFHYTSTPMALFTVRVTFVSLSFTRWLSGPSSLGEGVPCRAYSSPAGVVFPGLQNSLLFVLLSDHQCPYPHSRLRVDLPFSLVRWVLFCWILQDI